MPVFVIHDGSVYRFKSAYQLKTWVEAKQELMTYPEDCGAEKLGPALSSDLSIEEVEQIILHEKLFKSPIPKKAFRKPKYRNSR